MIRPLEEFQLIYISLNAVFKKKQRIFGELSSEVNFEGTIVMDKNEVKENSNRSVLGWDGVFL